MSQHRKTSLRACAQPPVHADSADTSDPYANTAISTDGMTQASTQAANYTRNAAAPASGPSSNPEDAASPAQQPQDAGAAAPNSGSVTAYQVAPDGASPAAAPANWSIDSAAGPAAQGTDRAVSNSAASPSADAASPDPDASADGQVQAALSQDVAASPSSDSGSTDGAAAGPAMGEYAAGPSGGDYASGPSANQSAAAASPDAMAALDAAAQYLSDTLAAASDNPFAASPDATSASPDASAASPDASAASPASYMNSDAPPPGPLVAAAGDALFLSAMAALPPQSNPGALPSALPHAACVTSPAATDSGAGRHDRTPCAQE